MAGKSSHGFPSSELVASGSSYGSSMVVRLNPLPLIAYLQPMASPAAEYDTLERCFKTLLACYPCSSPGPTAHSIPIDIWEHVIDLVEGDYDEVVRARTLASCALTCRAWLPRARHHLYRYVVIFLSPPPLQNQPTLFLDTLRRVPSYGAHVRSLTIRARIPDAIFSAEDIESNNGSALSLMAVQLPNRLPNLHSLTLDAIDLVDIHPTFYGAFSRFRSVKRLVLNVHVCTTINQIYRLLKAFCGLLSLSIDFVSNGANPLLGVHERHQKTVSVPSLILFLPTWYCWHAMNTFAIFAPCTELTLTMRWTVVPEMSAITRYLRLCGESLRKANVTLSSSEPPSLMAYALHSLNFSTNENLESVSLTITCATEGSLGTPNSRPENHSRRLVNFLSRIPTKNLHSLDVHLRYLNTSVVHLHSHNWEALDRYLSTSALTNVLSSFNITFSSLIPWKGLHGLREELSATSVAHLLPRFTEKATAANLSWYRGGYGVTVDLYEIASGNAGVETGFHVST
ncbi:hypothetical protein BXZ70DRAFT_804320 [Cristinia sonorae]|uniref:F-box domain-containing protein n=1 Tax=Cristinia sonorae TaxID=1940300 RepID=A0A8K0US09_9AGAR|nr:hypothetical protein BXZ70DRAFT_804320 [Cristinia sonorae]